ncbi:MAG TPA: substrate-binding domain-containing protein [Streptosporangiaceae bacterium]|nr:substrate-binding domain-containing protein [Streptosporangiaceae bacterium]
MRSVSKAVAAAAIASSAALLVAACGSSNSGSSSKLSASQVPQLSYTDFKLDFSAMAKLKILASHGSGKIAAILPDTVSSTRYVEFDAPYLKKALTDAGLKASDQIIQNAQGSDATEYADAQADITKGAKVLIMDPIDPGVGQKIEAYAKKQGVPVIDYDRITLGGSRKYYVSFNNVQVGTLLGQGLESCITAWKVKSPKVIVMRGDPTDNNATLFADGYDAVLKSQFSSKAYTDVSNPAGTWTPTTALSEFQAAYTKNPDANALLSPNDENAAPIIHYLQTKGVKAGTFPVTGQDATLTGIQNIIAGYQCGTVYKPIYLEAQAAVALAMYLRADITPPSSLVNGSVTDINEHAPVQSILEKPEWVTPQTVESTVVKDGFVPASQICTGAFKADCTKYGIS